MSNYQELLAQKAALEKQAADLEKQLHDARRTERAGVIAQIKSLLAEHGLTVADLGLKPGKAASSVAAHRLVARWRPSTAMPRPARPGRAVACNPSGFRPPLLRARNWKISRSEEFRIETKKAGFATGFFDAQGLAGLKSPARPNTNCSGLRYFFRA